MILVEWLEFLKRELPDGASELILPVDRTRALDFEWKPGSPEEFELTIGKAPIDILEGLGFVRYSSLTDVYKEQQQQVWAKIGAGNELMLFPVEWYALIPEDFSAIGINGDVVIFQKGVTDGDARWGCLWYGVAVPAQ